MDCSQILPGAVSPGQCSVATGSYAAHPFIVYASGKDVVILDGTLRHLQTILGSSRGYCDVSVSCVDCSETSGQIAAVWGCDVVFLQPVPKEDMGVDSGTRVSSDFPGQWEVSHTQVLSFPPKSVSWNRDGSQLLVGGMCISLWSCDQDTNASSSEGMRGVEWAEVWKCDMGRSVVHLKFSPDGTFFASAGENDCFIKIWYQSFPYAGGLGSSKMFSFAYIAHPQTITGFEWRHTSTHMPRGYVPNVLLSYCKDNVCRLWSHSVNSREQKHSSEQRYTLRFFIAASIDPISDIPFRTTLPVNDDLPFAVHWLNNKSTAFTNKAEKFHAGALMPMSRFGSLLSFASSINDEMLQSWVCVDDREQPIVPNAGQSSHEGEAPKKPHSYSLSNFLSLNKSSSVAHKPTSSLQENRASEHKRALAHLMDDWNSSPDLLLCIHPTAGSLMVWTVEGLDAPPHSSRLVHVSFSSCLPHIFPPHLSQSLRQNLLQFIIKEPEAVQTKVATSGGETVSNMSLPVPSIRLPGTGMGIVDGLKNSPKYKPESTLYLISSHMNGSLHTWSVELTPQSNYSTSIAGLIHCGGTGGHHRKVHSIQRHPWLPVVMTVSSQEMSDNGDNKDKAKNPTNSVPPQGNKEIPKGPTNVASELIIWNADLPGPLQHKSRLNELCRMLSTDPTDFKLVTWVPPISVGSGVKDVFARCPSSGIFVANIGQELCLFQTSLYCVTKSSSGMTPHSSLGKGLDANSGGHSMTVTSQLGKEGVCKIDVVIDDISKYEDIVGLHSFRMCSLVTSFDIKKSLDSTFYKDVVIVVLENRAHVHLKTDTPISRGVKTFVHMWQVTLLQDKSATSPTKSAVSTSLPYKSSIAQVYLGELPLLHGSHVIHSSPACDVSSSLQLQLPTLSSPFLFTTASSDGSVQCWQFCRKPKKDQTIAEDNKLFDFELYEVFGSSNTPLAPPDNSISTKCLDCSDDATIKALPTTTPIPCAISSAYPGRFALAHQLLRPLSHDQRPLSPAGPNTLDQHAAVTIWECESSGGLKWNCEATLSLTGASGVLAGTSNVPPTSVMMDWVPMENGAYLLATCFASTVSIFGMRLPRGEDEFMTANKQKGFTSQANTLIKTGTQASWQCLVQFPCSQPSLGLTIRCFAYTGSNSLVLSVDSEMHLYSCWVREDRLFPLLNKSQVATVTNQISQMFHKPSPPSNVSDETKLVNLLDYAHAVNTPLPQYHPKILIELMNSGKLKSVKAILVNLVKYLLLYSQKKKPKGNYFEEGGLEAIYEESGEVEDVRRKRLLSVSSDGILRRSRKIDPKTIVERVPHLSLAKMGILTAQDEAPPEALEEKGGGLSQNNAAEDKAYDELFTTKTLTDTDAFMYGYEEEDQVDLSFADLEPGSDDFTPELAKQLSAILRYAQLMNLSDLEQVRLLAIAATVANTKRSFGERTHGTESSTHSTNLAFDLGTTAGSGYASSGLSHGVGGGEAMDDCGLRYLLALQNYTTLSESLPSSVTADRLPTSDFIWAFHSEAETELLAAIPCVQEDKLIWAELRDVGVGWWLRSSDKLRLLIERLAKAQFMYHQDPLDAVLFYIAMKKQSLVRGLFKTTGDQKMATFFAHDFSESRWKTAALKNAFVLLGKQRFQEAAAFFLLAGKLWDAVEVCVDRLGDLQLAFVTIRLYEGDHGPIYRQFINEFILGLPDDQTLSHTRLEPSPDPFLRSIASWLMQDYSAALDTLLLSQQASQRDPDRKIVFKPAIFNFYFFLRSSPLLIRRDLSTQVTSTLYQRQSLNPSQSGKSSTGLSNVGDEPLTPAERNLLFSTAYHYLSHGCPLLALNVLSRLPKSCSLGSEVCTVCILNSDSKTASTEGGVSSGALPVDTGAKSVAGMIESGTIGDAFGFGGSKTTQGGGNDDDFDWSQPASTNRFKEDEDDFDWSKPITSNRYQDDEDEFDWSKPISTGKFTNGEISPLTLELSPDLSDKGEEEADGLFLDHQEEMRTNPSSSTLSTHGLFILSLAEQLQYNACLSILTEELITIYVPACCQYLWTTKGKDSLPLLPLPKAGKDARQTLASHFEGNVFEKTILNLRALLVTWLKEETKLVKDICGFEEAVEDADEQDGGVTTAPAGYDLLTTLMNYVSLHAATSPSLHTIHLELMHLMNTLLPWSTGALDIEPTPLALTTPNCAVDPSQLPILTSSYLPARHLTNLTLHLRLMSARIVTILSEHTYPPIFTQALPHVGKVFELCCALSSCMSVCLSPTRFTDFTSVGTAMMTSELTPSPNLTDSGTHQQTGGGSPYVGRAFPDHTLTRPNTKPSNWPGISDWPSTLSSDEGKDPTPLSLVLVECLVTVYLGLFSAAWSQHSITDLLLLLKNRPSGDMWYDAFGGGIDIKKDDKMQRAMSRSKLIQSVENMALKFKKLRRSSSVEAPLVETAPKLFVPPQKTLLDCYLTVPKVEGRSRDNSLALEEGYFVCGIDEDEDTETETEDLEDSGDHISVGVDGPMFRVGSVGSEMDSSASGTHNDPNSFAWCLMNLGVSKLLMASVRKVLSTAGVEVIELITASPLLYSTLKLLEEWESIFTKRLDSLGPVPDDFFARGDDPVLFQVGPALTRQKFILEPENSPFSGKSKQARQAKHLWQYLVHRDEVLETFIHHLFKSKPQKGQSPSRSLGSLTEEDDEASLEKSHSRLPVTSECRVVYKEHDSTIGSFCVNSGSQMSNTVLALALSREVIEIEVPDTSLLDTLPEGEAGPSPGSTPNRSLSMPFQKEDFVMIQSNRMKKPQSSAFLSGRLSLSTFTHPSATSITHSQTGQSSSLLMRRNVVGVRRMAPHPTLAYYLTGCMDGSVLMWEFGNPRPVSTQIPPGSGASVTMIRFTPEGNKYGVTDNSGKLSLWQGIHTAARKPYHSLYSGMKHLSDFLFLGSSSFIATCGDGSDNRHVFLWDTLLPTKSSVVKEFMCHESGVVSLGYSRAKQRLFCGDRRGEVLIFDLRQMCLLQSLTVHSSAVNRIVVDDIDGFIATGSADGDIKVLDSNSFEELASYPGLHAKSRLFRQTEGGVTDLGILPGGRLYSCGADGSVKCQTVVL